MYKRQDEGCVALADALARNASLVALDLRRTRFGPAAANAFAVALAKNASLESLRLDDNDVGADGCAALLRALDASVRARRAERRVDPHAEPGTSEQTESRASLRSVSLVGVRTEDAAVAARALGALGEDGIVWR